MDTRPRTNPFPGLRPFMQEEADLFFGRDRQSDQLVRRLGRRFLAVVGTSGSGKSSLVRAGLLPSLEAGFMADAGTHWRIATLRPQSDPIGSLARAIVETGALGHLDLDQPTAVDVAETTLRRTSLGLVEAVRLARLAPHENLLVLVDQFEELFRFADLAKQRDAGDEAPAFVKLLLAAAQQTERPVYVVITMRSDFLGDCDRFRGLPEAISDSQYLIPRLTRDELQAVITGPIGVRGGRIAPSLVQALLNDVGDDMDQLPVLQHALMRAWDHWERTDPNGRPIELDDLIAIGGMADALSRHADEAYGSLSTDRDRRIAERLFKCLTERGPDNREIRRPTPLSRIAAIAGADTAEVRSVVETFRAPGRSFLMPPHGVVLEEAAVVDISHESLIRQWGRLRTWAEEEAESRATYLRLVEAARLRLAGRAGLWGEPDLTYARQWEERESPNPTWAEQYSPGFDAATEFLLASRARDAQRLEDEERRRQAELVVAREKQIAAEALAAEQLRATARAQADADRLKRRGRQLIGLVCAAAVVALLAAWFGWKARSESVLAEQQFRQATALRLNTESQATMSGARAGGSVLGLLKLLAAHRIAPHVEIESAMGVQVMAQDRLEKILTASAAVTAVAFSPDGTRLVSANFDNTLQIWDAANGLPIGAPLQGHEDYVTSTAYSPDGTRIVSGSEDGTMRLWNAEDGRPIGDAIKGHSDSVNCVAFSPDSTRIVSGSDDKTLRLWDGANGQAVGAPIRGHTDFIFSVAFSGDGSRIVSGSRDKTLRQWDAKSGRQIGPPMTGHDGSVTSVAFSPDGRQIVSGGDDKVLRLWNAKTGGRVGILFSGHDGSVSSVTFSPDGTRILSGSHDKTVRLWDVKTGKALSSWLGHDDKVNSVAFNHEGTRVVSGSDDGTVRLWDARVGQPADRLLLEGHRDYVSSVAFNADGTRIVSGGSDNSLRLWDAETGLAISTLAQQGVEDVVTSVGFSPDGTRIVSGSFKNTLQLWDATSGESIRAPMQGHDGAVMSVAFSPDGARIVSGSADNTLRLWDAGNGHPIGAALRGHDDAVNSVAFSRDGTRIVSGSDDQTLRLWDGKTGQPVGGPMRGHGDKVRSVAFSPDGTRIVSGGEDKVLRLWDAKDGHLIGSPMRGHDGSVTSVAFSPDGRRIVSGAEDRNLRLWDVASGQPIGMPLEGHLKGVTSVAFNPAGTRIASGSKDMTVRVWSSPVVWPSLLCAKLTRNMSHGEWRQLVSADLPFICQCPGLPIPADNGALTPAPEICPAVASSPRK